MLGGYFIFKLKARGGNFIVDISEHQKYAAKFEQIINERRDIMRIAVCGRFKSGKTSLLNLMLGLALPVKVKTATGIVTKIKYGVRDTVQLADGSFRQVSKEELNNYISVQGKTLDGVKTGEAVTAFTGCESNLLQKGEVEFWDTPGLDDDYRLTEITLEAVSQCDVVIFVLDATQFLSLTEKILLNGKLQEQVGNNIIVVINRLDMIDTNSQHQIYQEAEELTRLYPNLGNDICGYEPIFTCAASINTDIEKLMHRITSLCLNNIQRRTCIKLAHKAKLGVYAKKWLAILSSDYEQVCQEKLRCKREMETFLSEQQIKLENSFKVDKASLMRNIQTASLVLDSTERWTNVLKRLQAENGWETKYIILVQEVMKKELEYMFAEIIYAAKSSISQSEYPSCFPLPEISTEQVWDNMNWGSNFSANHMSGMLAGAAAGAAAGSIVPGVGTVIGGVIGLFLGAGHDNSKDEQEKAAFQNQCIINTIRAFQNGPAGVAKQNIRQFQDILVNRMKNVFRDKMECINISYDMQNSYDELCRQEKQLSVYMSLVSHKS